MRSAMLFRAQQHFASMSVIPTHPTADDVQSEPREVTSKVGLARIESGRKEPDYFSVFSRRACASPLPMPRTAASEASCSLRGVVFPFSQL